MSQLSLVKAFQNFYDLLNSSSPRFEVRDLLILEIEYKDSFECISYEFLGHFSECDEKTKNRIIDIFFKQKRHLDYCVPNHVNMYAVEVVLDKLESIKYDEEVFIINEYKIIDAIHVDDYPYEDSILNIEQEILKDE
jgi:hypothetical protein